ncbi:MAG: chaperone protein DnaJ, partial [Actinomycetia bacterium]|nr:chaperone protein DnaJ [Actinomycetes bacterium]
GVEMRAREVKVRVPTGVDDGQRIRVKGRGAAGANGGPSGDLYVVVSVKPHPLFGRNGNNLTVRLPLTFAEATLGAEVKVPTLDDPVTVRIPPGTPSGKTLRVRGRGIPSSDSKASGDLLVTVDVQVPGELTDEQRLAIEALAEAFPDDPRAELMATHTRRSSD